jgi:hypothetical protein
MKKSSRKSTTPARVAGNAMRPEYDFSGGVRGKYADRAAAGTNLVFLDDDVLAAFPDSHAVNTALRSLLAAGTPPPPLRPA